LIALDTSLLVRFFARDVETLANEVVRLVSDHRVYVPITVLAETDWVLRSRYGFQRSKVAHAFAKFMVLPTVAVQHRDDVGQAIAWCQQGLDFADRVLTSELNAVSDNPVVFEKDDFVSGGNFHGQTLALALDTLGLALHYVGAFAERRVARLVNPALNRGLPAFLAPTPGRSSGFMIPQYLAAALVNENQTLVHPASAGSLPTSADQEDFVSMGAWAGAKLRRLLGNVQRVVAVEWIVAAQALEDRHPQTGGSGSEAALGAVRKRVAAWSEDRSPAADIDRVARGIADGSLVQQVRSAVPF